MYYFKQIAVLAAAYILNLNLLTSAEVELEKVIDLRPYTVTGSIGDKQIEDSIIPVTELSGNALRRARSHSLGETLDGLAGVHSTAFGSGASRPIIRGFDGPRVHVMEDGVGTLDVSDSSPDHAVTVIPYFAEYIDVVRGPASLLYGSSAIGGVVNVIGSRFPVRRDLPAFQGELDSHYETASSGFDIGGVATLSQRDWAIRVNTLWVDHDDYDIPGFSDSVYRRQAVEHEHEEHEEHEHEEDEQEEHEHEEDELEKDTLANSFVRTKSGSVGLSFFPTESSRLSVALFTQQSEYGVPGHVHHHEEEHESEEHHHEEGVYVDLDQRKLDVDFEVVRDGDFLENLKFRFLYADYEHKEMEGDEVGTYFKRKGWESRMETLHRWNDNMTGIWGMQVSNSDHDSKGEEAVNPNSETFDFAVFALEEWQTGDAVYNMGARMERRDLNADQKESYEDWATSLSLGAKFNISKNLSLNTSVSRSERHPTVTELFADGVHVATRQYEIGDESLGKETSWSIDTGVSWNSDKLTMRLNLFGSSFSDYIFAAPGNRLEEGLQVFEFEAVDATFYGTELEAEFSVFQTAGQQLMVRGLFDFVNADISDSGEILPRIPSARIGGAFVYDYRNISVFGNLRYSFKASEVADHEYPTDEYWQLDLGLEYTAHAGTTVWVFYIKGRNVLDEEIRKHTSFLKDLAPLPGRNIIIGCRIAY